MKCAECQTENPDRAKFCIECGNPMEFHCPECGAKTPAEGKFCMGCGHNLISGSEPTPKDLSFDEKLDKIQRYLPKGLTEKILAQRDKIEGERKQVTVMFCDMEGFTALVENLGPEEVYSIMDQVYEILIHMVHDYEGTVNEMTGDGIMAIFGAPIALEDAPQRAIRSAYSIHREMTKFSDKIRKEKEGTPPLKMRIGIHTGPVVVGTLGNDLRVEFKAVGDTVNLASRMEGLAEPGATYVSEDTFKLTEGFFRFEALGEKEIRGKKESVNVYRVIAPSTRRTRFDVSAERGLTPFVGRERELELLLDGFERVKQGMGQAFSIMAEAGIGKSRLLYEFRKAVANEDVTFLEGKCLSYSRGVAYHPVIDVLKSNFDVREDDGDSEIREKVIKQLNIIEVDEASTLPCLLELLSVKNSGLDQIPMSPEAKKDRIMEAVKRIALRGSEIRPLIMAIEDLHWIDKSSEDSLKDLLDSIAGSKVFLIFTYRPEFVHTWGNKSYHSKLNVNRFSNREILAVVSHLFDKKEIENDLEQLILEKTEGIPFFIEEFVKSLKDLSIIEKKDDKYNLAKNIRALTIPSTIQDVIMARVDSLPEDAKEVLQTGSVIEREFSYTLIKRVTQLSEQKLMSLLSVLKDSEVIYERGVFPQSNFIFKHALTREVVYDSILTRRKKALHEEISNAIEEIYKENLDEHYGILAEHFIASENYQKGAEYSRLTGKKAEKSASFPVAIEYANKGVACLEKLPQKEDLQKTIIDARVTLGIYVLQMCYFIEAREAVEPVVDLAFKHGYKRRLSQIYTILGAYNYWIEEDFPKAFEHLEEAVRIAEEGTDIISVILASLGLGMALSLNCDFERAIHYIGKTFDVNVAANSRWGISVAKSNLSVWTYDYHGMVNLGYQTSEEAIQIADESGDILSKLLAYTCHGISGYYKGFLEEAKENLLKGVGFCERFNLFVYNALAHYWLGELYFEIEEYQESIDYYNRAILLLERNSLLPSWVSIIKIGVARAKAMNSEIDIDLESLYGHVTKNRVKVFDGQMRKYISEIILNIYNEVIPEAEDWIKKAIEADQQNGMMWHLGKDYALYAELFKRKGDLSKARENLGKAIEILKECGAYGWIEKYEKELSALS